MYSGYQHPRFRLAFRLGFSYTADITNQQEQKMERDKPSMMIRVPTPLVPVVRQLSALYREARQQRDGYDGKKHVDASAKMEGDDGSDGLD